MRKLIYVALTILAGIATGALMVVIAINILARPTSAPNDNVTVQLRDVNENGTMQAREQAALEMIRLGALDWMTQCAYEMGQAGETKATAQKSCTPDFKLGEFQPEGGK